MIKLYEAKITDFTQADYTKMYSLLECAIQQKIDLKADDTLKKQSLAGYILLYRAIKELFKKTELKIYFNKHGKPLCDICFFSISHSNEQVICVVSDKSIGADIQYIKSIKAREKYKLFTSKENDYVNQTTDGIDVRYTEVFTKKEAAVKMLGIKLSQGGNIDTFSNKYCFNTTQKENFVLSFCYENV